MSEFAGILSCRYNGLDHFFDYIEERSGSTFLAALVASLILAIFPIIINVSIWFIEPFSWQIQEDEDTRTVLWASYAYIVVGSFYVAWTNVNWQVSGWKQKLAYDVILPLLFLVATWPTAVLFARQSSSGIVRLQLICMAESYALGLVAVYSLYFVVRLSFDGLALPDMEESTPVPDMEESTPVSIGAGLCLSTRAFGEALRQRDWKKAMIIAERIRSLPQSVSSRKKWDRRISQLNVGILPWVSELHGIEEDWSRQRGGRRLPDETDYQADYGTDYEPDDETHDEPRYGADDEPDYELDDETDDETDDENDVDYLHEEYSEKDRLVLELADIDEIENPEYSKNLVDKIVDICYETDDDDLDYWREHQATLEHRLESDLTTESYPYAEIISSATPVSILCANCGEKIEKSLDDFPNRCSCKSKFLCVVSKTSLNCDKAVLICENGHAANADELIKWWDKQKHGMYPDNVCPVCKKPCSGFTLVSEPEYKSMLSTGREKRYKLVHHDAQVEVTCSKCGRRNMITPADLPAYCDYCHDHLLCAVSRTPLRADKDLFICSNGHAAIAILLQGWWQIHGEGKCPECNHAQVRFSRIALGTRK